MIQQQTISTSSDTAAVISDITQQLIASYHPQKVILFGSSKHGEIHKGSDIDIAIIKSTHQPYHERVIEARRCIRSTIPVDVFVFTPEEVDQYRGSNALLASIFTTGRVVYGE
jgi:predicted nucleotidyltransferase